MQLTGQMRETFKTKAFVQPQVEAKKKEGFPTTSGIGYGISNSV